jgi:hypothetical protein
MLDRLKEDIKRLGRLKEFKEFKRKNKESYLCACFLMYSKPKGARWDIDFYNPKDKKITTFKLDKKLIVKKPEKVFQKEKTDVQKLEIKDIKIGFDKALKIINKLRDEKYSDQKETQKIIILQNIKDKIIWNITYLTNCFNLLNAKIDAIEGNLIEESLSPVLSFKAK